MGKEEDMDSENLAGLKSRQIQMYKMFEDIAKELGPWKRDSGADGAHYVEESPFIQQGMICANCAFYKGGQICEIVEGEGTISPLAICKLWVIRDSLIKE